MLYELNYIDSLILKYLGCQKLVYVIEGTNIRTYCNFSQGFYFANSWI